MSRKLFAACLVITAFALVPSLASANPILTEPTGTALALSPTIIATNVGATTLTTSVGNLKCSTAVLEGRLHFNTTSNGAKGEIESARFGGTGPGVGEPECTGEGFFSPNTTVTPSINLPWCLEAAASTDTFTLRGGPCGAPRAINFNLDLTEVGTCEYSRVAAMTGTIGTDGSLNENTLAIENQEWTKSGGPFLCPGSSKLDARFILETPSVSTIFISS